MLACALINLCQESRKDESLEVAANGHDFFTQKVFIFALEEEDDESGEEVLQQMPDSSSYGLTSYKFASSWEEEESDNLEESCGEKSEDSHGGDLADEGYPFFDEQEEARSGNAWTSEDNEPDTQTQTQTQDESSSSEESRRATTRVVEGAYRPVSTPYPTAYRASLAVMRRTPQKKGRKRKAKDVLRRSSKRRSLLHPVDHHYQTSNTGRLTFAEQVANAAGQKRKTKNTQRYESQ